MPLVEVNVFFDSFRRRRLSVFIPFGLVTEQSAPAKPTPQYRGKKEGPLMASLTLGDNQTVPLGPITFTDKRGNPTAPPTGAQPPKWSVDDATLVAITPSADGLSCQVSALGKVSQTGATVSVVVTDAAGNNLASGSVLFPIVAEAPTTVAIPIGTPTEQP